jgi:putative ABC transport system permease protein
VIRNYFKIALRNISRHKVFAGINIVGLAVGIAACILLFTVVKYELSYDTFQPAYKRIHRVVTETKNADGSNYTPGVPIPALDALRIDIPQARICGLFASYGSQVTVLTDEGNNPDKKFIEDAGVFFTDPEFFEVFNYKWLYGSPAVLKEPNATVLTKKMAEKYFGTWKDAIGKSIKLGNAVIVKIVGILENVPLNSDFPLAVVTSFETFKRNAELYGPSDDWGWTSSNFQVYMQLPPNMPAANVNTLLKSFTQKNFKNRGRSERICYLQPLSSIHFDSKLPTFGDHMVSKSTLWTLSLIGVFIIIMACINFINLSTAQAVGRSKEIGIRKVLGSNRKQLFGQVMGETVLIVFLSVLLAATIAFLCLPYIKNIASIEERLSLFNSQTLLFLLAVILAVSLLAGLYPSTVLSGFKPAFALKNKITSATVGGISLRRGLVILQFAISQMLIIGTIIAITQMNFVRNADLGFNKEAISILNVNTADSVLVSRQPAFKQKLLDIPGVQSVSFSTDVPSSDNNWATNFAFNHKPDEDFHLYTKFADEDYFKTFGLDFIAGRSYSKSDTTNEVVVNQALLRKLGIKDPQAAIGMDIRTGRSPWKKIVGVVRDFKTNSLREEIKPTMIAEFRQYYTVTSVKLNSRNISQTQAAISSAWNEFYPEYAYKSSFFDENINEFYEQEEQLSLLYKIFAGIAIFISCLGLYGLVSFMAVQKTKEIGVRKVLGASVKNIIFLFSKEFTVLILAGFLISAPVAYYLMDKWLADFVFRIHISPLVFFIAVLLSVLIAWITVGYKSVKAALANPVKSLRSE